MAMSFSIPRPSIAELEMDPSQLIFADDNTRAQYAISNPYAAAWGMRRSQSQTPFSGEPGMIDPEWARSNPEAAQARLLEEQWKNFEQHYRPLEDRAIQQLSEDKEGYANEAGRYARQSMDQASGSTLRDLARYGVSPTGAQARAIRRLSGLDTARAVTAAENSTRRGYEDSQLKGLGTMLSVGRGISGSAGEALGQAASLETARDAQGDAARAQARAQRQNMAMAGVGMLLSFL